MKLNFLAVVLVGVCLSVSSMAQSRGPVPNPAIDMEGFLKVSAQAAKHRESRRLTEEEFIQMSSEPGTIVLDARSKEKYDELIKNGLTPIARWGSPDDVAKAVLAIAQEAFPFSTGEVINVDGGFHLRRL